MFFPAYTTAANQRLHQNYSSKEAISQKLKQWNFFLLTYANAR